jgi:hypothetical protein
MGPVHGISVASSSFVAVAAPARRWYTTAHPAREILMSDPALTLQAPPGHDLRDGRRVAVLDIEGGQRVELVSPSGDVEVSIAVTADGPVVRLVGARLELEAVDVLSMKARVIDMQASESARVHSDGQLTLTSGLDTRMVAEGDVHVLGKLIWLN